MKLMCEYTEPDLEVLTEAKDGKKKYYIEGIFAQAEKTNRNGRIYPKGVMESALKKYDEEQVQKNRAVGELNHPEGPIVNLDKVSHRIVELKFEGNNVIGKALILKTPMGEIVEGLLEGEVQLGVSTRGMGSLVRKGNVSVVKEDFILGAVDIVQDPSGHEAFVNGIMEGVDWVWDNGIIKPQVIERMETEIKNTPKAFRPEVQLREFKNFLSLISQS